MLITTMHWLISCAAITLRNSRNIPVDLSYDEMHVSQRQQLGFVQQLVQPTINTITKLRIIGFMDPIKRSIIWKSGTARATISIRTLVSIITMSVVTVFFYPRCWLQSWHTPQRLQWFYPGFSALHSNASDILSPHNGTNHTQLE